MEGRYVYVGTKREVRMSKSQDKRKEVKKPKKAKVVA